jgi:2-polyprenyl-3-methyl-5-hydroxy-6-metoxy-1,4-benzoquinol methylase
MIQEGASVWAESERGDKRGIWSLETSLKRHRCDASLAVAIAASYKPSSAVDLGCGLGAYCKILDACGWSNVAGIEGTPGVGSAPSAYRNIFLVDLTEPINPAHSTFEFVLCLEVGEHIPRIHEKVFVDNMCALCNMDMVISWALPNQGGTDHVNKREQHEVEGMLAERGLVAVKGTTEYLRSQCYYKYFQKTVTAYRRDK